MNEIVIPPSAGAPKVGFVSLGCAKDS